MATTYQKCDETVRELLDELLQKHRSDLIDAQATIELLFAFGTDGKPALKKSGQVVLGRCKINSLQDRAEGKADATITLDGDRWPKMNDRRRLALLHHELTHIDRWEPGDKDRDDLGRPALAARHGDWNFDGFHRILDLYGEDSVEHRNLAIIAESHRQLKLPISAVADQAEGLLRASLDSDEFRQAVARDLGGTVEAKPDGALVINVPASDDADDMHRQHPVFSPRDGAPDRLDRFDQLESRPPFDDEEDTDVPGSGMSPVRPHDDQAGATDGFDPDDVHWLANTPCTDVNFRCAINRSSRETLAEALTRKLTRGARQAIERRLRGLDRATA